MGCAGVGGGWSLREYRILKGTPFRYPKIINMVPVVDFDFLFGGTGLFIRNAAGRHLEIFYRVQDVIGQVFLFEFILVDGDGGHDRTLQLFGRQ